MRELQRLERDKARKQLAHEDQCEDIATKGNAEARGVMEELRQLDEEEGQRREERRHTSVQRRVYQDVGTVVERMSLMRVKTLKWSRGEKRYEWKELACAVGRAYYQRQDEATAGQRGREPNNSQFAVSAYLVSELAKPSGRRKVLAMVPPGLGKTRILATVVFMQTRYRRVVIAYPSAGLLENDAAAIQSIRQNNASIDIRCVVPAEEEKEDALRYDSETLLIMDEADTFLLDRAMTPEAGAIIGLTATAIEDAHDNEARWLMETQRFAILDPKFARTVSVGAVETVASIGEFFARSKDMPRLVFCDREDFLSVLNCLGGHG